MSKPLPGQQSLFGAPRTGRDIYDEADAKPVRLNSTVEEQDAPRLSTQHHTILTRLREGPATNVELGQICQRFGARLNELKRAGHPWRKRFVTAGVYEYSLIGE